MSDADKYNAEILKIAGFAMMTPFGRVIIQPVVVFNEFGLLFFLFYLLVYIGLFILGIIFVTRGYDILDVDENK